MKGGRWRGCVCVCEKGKVEREGTRRKMIVFERRYESKRVCECMNVCMCMHVYDEWKRNERPGIISHLR